MGSDEADGSVGNFLSKHVGKNRRKVRNLGLLDLSVKLLADSERIEEKKEYLQRQARAKGEEVHLLFL